MTSEEVKASEKIAKKKWRLNHKKENAEYMKLRRIGQTPSQLKQKKIMDKKIGVGDNGIESGDNRLESGDNRLESGDNRLESGDKRIITISGKTKNLETLMKALAFPKGKNLLFPFRKIVIQKKSNEEKPRLVARQLAGAGSIYSQVFIKPDGTDPFLYVEGEGDMILDMKNALENIKALKMSKHKEAYVKYDIETHTSTFGSIESEIEYKNEEQPICNGNSLIDDASGILGVPCDCNQDPDCPTCHGIFVKPAPSLSYKNDIVLCAPDSSIYATYDVRFEVDGYLMKQLMKEKSLRNEDALPIQFTKDSLTVLLTDYSNNSFKKLIPVKYLINNMVDKQIWIGEYYKHIFNNLTEKITLFSANLPPDEESIYVSMNKPGGFHCGLQIQAKQKYEIVMLSSKT